uniref:tRNA (Adenosine(37)-N6)-threonylcarbamoyltransferase complex dimerization subunit type 1 TsaB n=1 Tax=Streptomyces avermitilis TaxID=33903 RepID=A0A499VLC8_STRAX|nr:hypothetical protein SAVMC3_56870 [Streptomyces avermitilis]
MHPRRPRLRLRPRRALRRGDGRAPQGGLLGALRQRPHAGHRARRGPAGDLDLRGLPAVGAGALLYPDAFPDAREPEHLSAAALASLAAEKLAAGEELEAPRPLYLRRPDAQVPKNYKVVTPK